MTDLMTQKEAAERLGVSRQRVSFLLHRGDIGTPATGIERYKVEAYAAKRKIGRPTGAYGKKNLTK